MFGPECTCSICQLTRDNAHLRSANARLQDEVDDLRKRNVNALDQLNALRLSTLAVENKNLRAAGEKWLRERDDALHQLDRIGRIAAVTLSAAHSPPGVPAEGKYRPNDAT